jgi:hypothetical protein
MSQFGGNIVGSLVVDIHAPPEKAVAGLRAVEAETMRVAATTTKAGETAGASFGIGMARGIGKSARYFMSAVNGLLVLPGVAIAAYKLGEQIGNALGDGILKAIDPHLFSLQQQVDATAKKIAEDAQNQFKEGIEARSKAGLVAASPNIDAQIKTMRDDLERVNADINSFRLNTDPRLFGQITSGAIVDDSEFRILKQQYDNLLLDKRRLVEQLAGLQKRRDDTQRAGSPQALLEKAIAKAVGEAVRDALREQQQYLDRKLDQIVQQVGDMSRTDSLRRYAD